MITLAGCDLIPSISISSSTPTAAVNTWNRAAPGVEVRHENWSSADGGSDVVTIVRFDLHYVKLSIGYAPDQPLAMDEWMQKEQALAVMNGGYFDAQERATALVISNGQTYGSSYDGFGGMLSVDAQGRVGLRSLSTQPYDPGSEQLTQATQSSPMLLENGKRTQFSADNNAARRSIVAMDTQGRLLFIVSPDQQFTLDDMATLLAKSDLSLTTALNLDGGASTGLALNAGSQNFLTDAFVNLPLVIVVKSK
jgi:exopolysaccharide biosynthesis protein